MKILALTVMVALLQSPLVSQAAMTDKQLYAVSMENDAQFIECVGNIFFAVANFQRVILEDLKWEATNSEFQKIDKSKESLASQGDNIEYGFKSILFDVATKDILLNLPPPIGY